MTLKVPVGTSIVDVDTDTVIADVTRAGERICIAEGGHFGLGNTRFKSSTTARRVKRLWGSQAKLGISDWSFRSWRMLGW